MHASNLNQIVAFARGLNTAVESALQSSFDRSLSEVTALVSIQNCDQFHIGWLAETLGIEHSSAVRVADRLERDGLISRLAKDSKKKVGLKITKHGSALAKEILTIRHDAAEAYLSALKKTEMITLTVIVATVIGAQTKTETELYRHCAMCDESACAKCPAGQGQTT